MEIVRALEDLRKHIEEPKSFLGLTVGLNKEECAVLIRRIHALLPEQVKQAAQITRESEKIVDSAKTDATMTLERAKSEAERTVADAKREADRVLEAARAERERMVADNEILKLAKQHAEQVTTSAESEAAKLRRSADDYAMDVLLRLENVVGKVMSTIERGKGEMQRPTHPVIAAKK
jgi:cell division septum initiation protein DivIVA